MLGQTVRSLEVDQQPRRAVPSEALFRSGSVGRCRYQQRRDRPTPAADHGASFDLILIPASALDAVPGSHAVSLGAGVSIAAGVPSAWGAKGAMKNYFSLLQENVLNRQYWATRKPMRIAILRRIERSYHLRRGEATLGRFTPIEFGTIMTTPARQAP